MPPFLRIIQDDASHGCLYLAQAVEKIPLDSTFRCVQADNFIEYSAFCDDFGPMNMASTLDFVRMLEMELLKNDDKKIVLCVHEGRRPLTNVVFLLGAYLILKQDLTPESVMDRFQWLDPCLLEPYRDATYSTVDFGLQIIDVWRGLGKIARLGSVRSRRVHVGCHRPRFLSTLRQPSKRQPA